LRFTQPAGKREVRRIRDDDLFERVCRGLQVAPREMQVNCGCLQIRMTEHHLDASQVGAGFEKVGGKAVAQGLLILLMICAQQRFAIGVIPSMA
jgi:hypothetical protein